MALISACLPVANLYLSDSWPVGLLEISRAKLYGRRFVYSSDLLHLERGRSYDMTGLEIN